jgi:hypothetical protein
MANTIKLNNDHKALASVVAIIRLGWKSLTGKNTLAFYKQTFMNDGYKKYCNIGLRGLYYKTYYGCNSQIFILS